MKSYNSIEELPASLNVNDVASFLQISKTYAYKLVNDEGFPIIRIGSRFIIPKDEFIKWIRENTKK